MSATLLRVHAHRPATRVAFTRTFVDRAKHSVKDPLTHSSNAQITELAPNLTFIHRPPPTAESPISYTTNPSSPLLRRPTSPPSAFPSRQYGTIPALNTNPNLPPPIRPISPKFNAANPQSYHLTQKEVDEIRRLRQEDPVGNPAWKLAEQFKCSTLFVCMVAPLKSITAKVGKAVVSEKERREMEREKKEARWGERKRIAREVRKVRKEKWSMA